MRALFFILLFLNCPLVQAAGNDREVTLVNRLDQLQQGLHFGAVQQFGQFESKMKEFEPEIYFSRQLQKKILSLGSSPSEIGFITLDEIIGDNLPVNIAQERMEAIYKEFYESNDDFKIILNHAKKIVTYADQLIDQLDALSARLQHQAEDKNDDSSPNNEEEKIKQSFVDTLRNWLHSFININESFIAYACSIVFPLLIQSIHEMSYDNTLPIIGLCAGGTFILREKILEKKIDKIVCTALTTAALIAFAAHNYGLLETVGS